MVIHAPEKTCSTGVRPSFTADVLLPVSLCVLTCVGLSRSDLHVQNVVSRALAREVQSMGVNVRGVGVLHRVPVPPGVRPFERVRHSQLVRQTRLHSNRGPRDLRFGRK